MATVLTLQMLPLAEDGACSYSWVSCPSNISCESDESCVSHYSQAGTNQAL